MFLWIVINYGYIWIMVVYWGYVVFFLLIKVLYVEIKNMIFVVKVVSGNI